MLFLFKLLSILNPFDVWKKTTHWAHGESVMTALPTCKKWDHYTFNIQNQSRGSFQGCAEFLLSLVCLPTWL